MAVQNSAEMWNRSSPDENSHRMNIFSILPSGYVKIAIENGHIVR